MWLKFETQSKCRHGHRANQTHHVRNSAKSSVHLVSHQKHSSVRNASNGKGGDNLGTQFFRNDTTQVTGGGQNEEKGFILGTILGDSLTALNKLHTTKVGSVATESNLQHRIKSVLGVVGMGAEARHDTGTSR